MLISRSKAQRGVNDKKARVTLERFQCSMIDSRNLTAWYSLIILLSVPRGLGCNKRSLTKCVRSGETRFVPLCPLSLSLSIQFKFLPKIFLPELLQSSFLFTYKYKYSYFFTKSDIILYLLAAKRVRGGTSSGGGLERNEYPGRSGSVLVKKGSHDVSLRTHDH